MKYCEKCRKLFDSLEYCPDCKKSRLREPNAEDTVLLKVVDHFRAEMLGALLDDEGIPYTRSGGIGSAFGMGVDMRLDSIRFYVNYTDYERAQDVGFSVYGAHADAESPEDGDEPAL